MTPATLGYISAIVKDSVDNKITNACSGICYPRNVVLFAIANIDRAFESEIGRLTCRKALERAFGSNLNLKTTSLASIRRNSGVTGLKCSFKNPCSTAVFGYLLPLFAVLLIFLGTCDMLYDVVLCPFVRDESI